MKQTLLALSTIAAIAAPAGEASAQGVGVGRGDNHALLVPIAAACFGGRPIPTEARPLHGERPIAKMRKAGQLPDTFVCGSCRFDIGGDPGVVYYVKTCR